MSRPCAECSDPVEDDEAHFTHETDCPNFGYFGPNDEVLCNCDLVVHPDCCPECNEQQSTDDEPA